VPEPESYDVAVVGGGPAGSTAAALLSKAGLSVLLLEKAAFPREHVGESLLPFCYTLFDELGVRDEMAARFVRKPGVRFVDRDGNASTTWCFNHIIDDESYLSFQVDRSIFDKILLDNASRLGARVLERTRVSEIGLDDPRRAVVSAVDADQNKSKYTARFLIDASGRDALVGSRMGWRTPRAELDRTALWSHWTGVKMTGGLEEGNSVIVYIGQEKKGWIWVFPLAADRITAGVVMQNSYLRASRERYSGTGEDFVTALYRDELRESPFVADLIDGARQAMPTLVAGDYSYEVRNHYGANYAMIGDARGFIDPIFSSGVFLSMKTAALVSEALLARLAEPEPERARHPALVHAYSLVDGAYGLVHRMIRLFYDPHAASWAELGADGQAHKAHETAMAAGHYMLAGDFFENHKRYSRFFELLEQPSNFEHYRKFVIERDAFRELSCHTPREVAFGGLTERFGPGEAAAVAERAAASRSGA
jgi:flavin-dependent dehydrogenase